MRRVRRSAKRLCAVQKPTRMPLESALLKESQRSVMNFDEAFKKPNATDTQRTLVMTSAWSCREKSSLHATYNSNGMTICPVHFSPLNQVVVLVLLFFFF